MAFLKGSKLYSIFTGTCPVCQNESMYMNANPYALGSLMTMHERCSHCGTKYKIEPSFFYGAMYVSYGVGVAVAVAAFVIAHLAFEVGMVGSFIAIIAALVILYPLIVRVSRNIWINFFMSYDASRDQKVNS